MIGKLRKTICQKGLFAAALTDLSNTFDCIQHQLLIAKLSAYVFDMKSIAFISAYLKNRKHETKIGSIFSECLNILFGVPQGFILGPLLFLIFIADFFIWIMNAPLTIFLDMALAVSLMFQKQMSIHFSTGSDKMAHSKLRQESLFY